MADHSYNASGKLPNPGVPSLSSSFLVPSTSQIKVDKNDRRATDHSMIIVQKKDGSIVKLWECSVCSRRFKYQYTLARHIPVHTDERCFKCDSCPKAFRQLSTLTQHKVIHSSVRPFSCEVCFKTFNRLSTLCSHRNTHFPEKRHVCATCGKGFHQKGNLRNHIYTHTNERPYKCDSCPKGFNQKSNLTFHKASAHSFVCQICAETFQKREAIDFHLAAMHGVISIGQQRTRSKKYLPLAVQYLSENNNNSTIDMNIQALHSLQVANRFQSEGNSYILRPLQTEQVFLLPLQDVRPLVASRKLAGEGQEWERPLFDGYAADENKHPTAGVANDVRAILAEQSRRRPRLDIPSAENASETEDKYRDLLNDCPSVAVSCSHASPDLPPLKSFVELKPPACLETVPAPEMPPPTPEFPGMVVQRVPIKLAPPKEQGAGANGPRGETTSEQQVNELLSFGGAIRLAVEEVGRYDWFP